MSKGTRPRPSVISQEEIAARHEEIFGKKPPKPRWIPPPLPEDMQNIQSSFDKQFGGMKLPNGRT
jgi:hypothetical protein